MDIISELPDTVLLHIMDLMEPKQAVQTCLLSKRWKNLCKRLTNLKFTFSPNPTSNYLPPWIHGVRSFQNFASWILYTRDHSYSLHNLSIQYFWTDTRFLGKLVKYALLHNIQHLEIRMLSCFGSTSDYIPLLFSSHTLTSLSISLYRFLHPSRVVLPSTLHLPSIKSLYLDGVRFTASDNHSAEPFSMCHVLHNLELQYCALHDDAQVLCISNSTLFSLTIVRQQASQIVLSTPSVSSLTLQGSDHNELISTCNLASLGEVNIDVNMDVNGTNPFIITWLQVLSNVKILTFYPSSFLLIYNLSSLISMGPQPPRFARLETLKVKDLYSEISYEEVSTVVEFLLQNSPMAKVYIKLIMPADDMM